MARRGPAGTIYEVAARAGVAISTVSLAINHPERVAPATRARVLDAIDDLGFVPKEVAVARARRGVGRIAVIAPFTSYPSFSRRLDGIMREAAPAGIQVTVFDHEDVAMSDAPALASLPMRGHFDGLIVMSVPVDEAIVARIRSRMAVVLLDQRHRFLSSISIDNAMGGHLAASHLAALGHERVAMVCEADRSALESAPGRLRAAGMRDVFSTAMVQIVVERGEDAGDRALDAVVSRPDPITAVFAENDLLAMRILGAAARRGVRVPQELSVVGFDDGPMAQAVGLTTIAAPLEETGAGGVRMLLKMIADRANGEAKAREVAQDEVLPVDLVPRTSTGPASTTMAVASKHFETT